MDDKQRKEMIVTALEMRHRAYTPYSHFHVGACLLGRNGKLYPGCNIENASFGATNCAERTAFFSAIAQGERNFEAIAIAGGPEASEPKDLCPPCGICRQVMVEFCEPGDFIVILVKSPDEYKEYTLEELLPQSFRPVNLEQ